jgi:hypothetical protein
MAVEEERVGRTGANDPVAAKEGGRTERHRKNQRAGLLLTNSPFLMTTMRRAGNTPGTGALPFEPPAVVGFKHGLLRLPAA